MNIGETKINKDEFRVYENAKDHVKEFYKLNHTNQTFDYVRKMKGEIFPLKNKSTFRELHKIINQIVDESDPDFENNQMLHNILTAEACKILFPEEDYMHLIGFLHDYGKVLIDKKLYGLPQWAVVGDTFPVGCEFSKKIVYSDYFRSNPDKNNQIYSERLGIYKENCGFDNVNFSLSHDEYIYQMIKANMKTENKIPEEALYIMRYHSFYAWHQHMEYSYLANEYDIKQLERLKKFQMADLYLKKEKVENIEEKIEYYNRLIEKYICGLDEEILI